MSMASHRTAAARFWFSTYGNGVWYTRNDSVKAVTAAQGLRRRTIATPSLRMVAATFWVAHRGGASRIDAATRQVKVYDRHFGIVPDRRMNTVVADARKRTPWFGTDAGVARYDASKDPPSLHPPRIATSPR